MKRSRLWWLLAALPLAYLPLAAQESAPPQKPAEPPAQTPVPAADAPAAQTPAPAAGEPADQAEPAREPAAKDEAPIEQVSADNNLSFPVDI